MEAALEKDNIPNICDTLADLHKFVTGEVLLADYGSVVRQIYFVRDKIHLITDTALWEFEPQDETIRMLVAF